MKSNRKVIFAAVICILLVAFTSKTALAADILLGKGESRMLPVQQLVRIAVADPEIADVLVIDDTQILLTAKNLGITTIHLWEKRGQTSYSLRVITNAEDLARELEELIGLPGVSVKIVEDTVIVDGSVRSERGRIRAIRAAGAYGNQVIDLLSVEGAGGGNASSSDNNQILTEQLGDALQEPNVSLTRIGDTLFLEGEVSSSLRHKRAVEIANAFGSKVVDLLVVSNQETGELKAKRGSTEDEKSVSENPSMAKGDQVTLEWLKEVVGIDTVKLWTIAGVVFIEGEVPSEFMKQKVETIVAAAGFEYRSFLTVAKPAGTDEDTSKIAADWQTIIAQIQDLVDADQLDIYVINDRLFLEGQVDTSYEKTRIEKIAAALIPSNQVVSLIQITSSSYEDTPIEAAVPSNDSISYDRLNDELSTVKSCQTEQKNLEERIQSVIPYSGVQVNIVEDTVVLRGEVVREDYIEKAQKLAEIFGFPVVNLLISSSLPEPPDRTNEIEKMIGLSEVRIKEIDEMLLLEGCVQTQLEYDRAERIARLYRENVVNLLTVEQPQQVLLQVRVIEASKTVLDKLGITWGNLSPLFVPHVAYLGQNEALGPVEFLSRLGGEIEVYLNDGEAKLLARPSILTLSGQKASFLAGGEIPVVVPSGEEVAVEWKEYGVKLDVTPQIERSGQITVSLRPEVSTLDWTNAVQLNTTTIPAMKTRRTETTVTLTDGGTLVLGGLIQSNESTQVDKVPLLGDLPVIGALFRSEQFQRNESDLIFLVTVKIISGPTDWATAAEMKFLPAQGGSDSE